MILVADSGSTKTNWIAINNKGETFFKIDTKLEGISLAILKPLLHTDLSPAKHRLETESCHCHKSQKRKCETTRKEERKEGRLNGCSDRLLSLVGLCNAYNVL